MATSVSCAVVAVFGIEDSKFGCSCAHHPVCGANVDYDTVVRLKTMGITTGKSIFRREDLLKISTHLVFNFVGNNKHTTILAAVWITDGMDRCVIGYVDPRAMAVRRQLEGRLGQVTELFSHSDSATKNRYSATHQGVCLVALIDNYLPNDDLINTYLDVVESDDSGDEN